MMKTRRDQLKLFMIASLVAGITLMHVAPLAGGLGTHLLHRELYFFPILLAGFWYGLIGGLATAVVVSIVYLFQFAATGILADVLTAVVSQILVFMAVGLFLGGMVDRQERRRRERDLIQHRLLEERMHQRAMQIQIETASKIQSLFRPKLPDLGFQSHVWAMSRPAKFVGGDLYDIIRMPDRSWLVYVADVSDKGLPAALIMAALWYRIHSEAHRHEDVGQLLTALNKPLYDLVSEEGYFVTIFIGRYWPAEGKLEYTSGGHPPAMKIRSDRFEVIDGRPGMSLGVVAESTYETQVTHIGPDEAILMMTDGFTDAMSDRQGTQCDMERIHQRLRQLEGPPWGPRLLDHINQCETGADQDDDLTLLEIWREPEPVHISRMARSDT